MGKGQRKKGHDFERKIARILQVIWPKAKRGFQSRYGGSEEADIIGTPYHFECSKGGESIWAKWKQAMEDSKSFTSMSLTIKAPIVIKQRDHDTPVVLLSLKTALTWLWKIHGPDMPIDILLKEYKKEFKTL